MKVVVFGAGRVGSAIIRDLSKDGEFQVSAFDASKDALSSVSGLEGVDTAVEDLSVRQKVTSLAASGDLVVGAVPGHMGFKTLEAVLDAGKPVVDISFFPEDPFELDELARSKGVTAVVDCGVAPGCSNLILGRTTAEFDRVDRFECCVGGLPVVRTWPYEYRAVFSPPDVIEEYTRPSRIKVSGRPITVPALSDLELLDFPGVGTLESFNTDGLRTLLKTIDVPNMKEKTLRYPGHAERMRMLRETGFFDKAPMDVGGAPVAPLDVTSQLLFSQWRLPEGEEDLTVMRVILEGEKDGRPARRRFDLFDRYDKETRTTSMARTTGYTCTAGVRALAAGLYRTPGITPPEFLGRDEGCFDFMMEKLVERGVVFRAS